MCQQQTLVERSNYSLRSADLGKAQRNERLPAEADGSVRRRLVVRANKRAGKFVLA